MTTAISPGPPAADQPARRPSRMRQWSWIVAAIGAGALAWASTGGLESQARGALGIFAGMIVLWLSEALPHAITGVLGCYLFWALGVTSFATAFGGFVSPTPAFLFAALLFGTIVESSGLAQRLARAILRLTAGSYSRALLGFVIVTFAITPLIPSGLAKVALLAAIGLGVMNAYGARSGGNVGRGVFLVLTFTVLLWDKTIIAGASTIVARGLIEQGVGAPVFWSHWFFAFLPVSLLSILACWGVTLALFRPEAEVAGVGAGLVDASDRPWSRDEGKAFVLLTVMIGLWMTDVIHHIRPEVVAIGVTLVAFLPGVEMLGVASIRRFDVTAVLFSGTAVSLGGVLIATGAVDPLASVMFSWLAPVADNLTLTTAALYWLGVGYHLVMPNAQSMLGTSLPPLLEFARSQDVSPLAAGMIWTFASGPCLMLYQSGIIILGYSYGHFDARDFLRFGLALTVVEFFILLATVVFFWPLIGLV